MIRSVVNLFLLLICIPAKLLCTHICPVFYKNKTHKKNGVEEKNSCRVLFPLLGLSGTDEYLCLLFLVDLGHLLIVPSPDVSTMYSGINYPAHEWPPPLLSLTPS